MPDSVSLALRFSFFLSLLAAAAAAAAANNKCFLFCFLFSALTLCWFFDKKEFFSLALFVAVATFVGCEIATVKKEKKE